MNILFISHLSNIISQGPNYSVPAQIEAQSLIDNVFWWNLTDALQNGWDKKEYFHGVGFKAKRISELPEPFSHPDLVIFESFYYVEDVALSRECKIRSIPYIIIPRSALTYQAQNQKKLKKIVGNIFMFNAMCKNASAIQYLTKKELLDSGDKWCKNSMVIPNGIEMPSDISYRINDDKTVITYIGRFDPYQKGLDLLLSAVQLIKSELLERKVVINLYGPERGNHRCNFKNEITEKGLNEVMSVKEGIFGEQKKNVLINSDLFITVSRFEGLPMSMLEALAYGLPCIASTGTNLSEEISSNEAGWACETDVDSISKVILNAVNSRDRYLQMSSNAVKLAKKYDWSSIAFESHNKYKKLKESD